VGLNAWTTSATMMLFYLAALQAIPTDVYEAAAIDGAKTWRTFWKITFPLLKPGHFFVAVVSIIGAMQIFDQAFIVSGGNGGPAYSTMTAVLYLYRTAIADVNFGYAAAIGVVLFSVIFLVTLLQRFLFGRAEVT
jgi:multiple sugar transport system permease protein